jgi:endoglucanase
MTRYILLLLALFAPLTLAADTLQAGVDPQAVVSGSWAHYKRTFIRDGRVTRPENGDDTVSEGQAYAMLRAVLMDDRTTFDQCLSWTESNLSRLPASGDRLLKWHYRNSSSVDSAPASDADIDYATGLVLAYRKWHDPRYLELARGVLDSILEFETLRIDGRLYLLPWHVDSIPKGEPVPQNPSYYAPAQFRLFYETTGDKRWKELVGTSYRILDALQASFGGVDGSGLVPDWCMVTSEGAIIPMPGKNTFYGWEAVRAPLRIAADWLVNRDRRALRVLRRFAACFDRAYDSEGKLCSTYDYRCKGQDSRENPLFYASAFIAGQATGSERAPEMLARLRGFLHEEPDGFSYLNGRDYYVNSLCWFAEYYQVIQQQDQKKHD